MLKYDDDKRNIMQDYKLLLEKINNAQKIGIITHIVPDGDAVGSSCGLAYVLKAMGKQVEVIFDKELKGEYDILDLKDVAVTKPTFEYDLFIATDCGDTTRFGDYETLYKNHPNTISIDHHLTNTNFAKLNYVDAERSSASEYVYDILSQLKLEIPHKSMNLFYVGIIRDCGAFMHDNTSAKTHRLVADLIDSGVEYAMLNTHFMQTRSLKGVILEKYALNTMEFFDDNSIVLMHLPLEVFQNEQCTLEDSGGIVSFAVSIEGVQLAIMCSEATKNVHKISFRSRDGFDCSVLSKCFGGGGHKKAAGCQLKGTFDFIRNQILTQVKKLKENIEQ